MRSTIASIPLLVIAGLVSLATACGGRIGPPSEEEALPSPERDETDDDGLFIPPQIPGVDKIADGIGTPSAIALSSDDVLFTTRSTLMGTDLVAAGGLYIRNKKVGVPLLLSVDGRGASYESLTIESNEAFIGTSDGRVLVIPLRGGEEKAIVTADMPLSAVTVSGTYVYYATNQNQVLRVMRTGGKSEPIGKVESPVRGIEIDGEAVYVATTNAIVRFKQDAGHAIEGASGAPCAMIRDARKLLWTNQNPVNGTVLQLALDVGDVQAVVAGPSNACGLAADATSVYFAARDTGLMRAPISGGEPTPVIGSTDALTRPTNERGAVAVDATHVYWLTPWAVLRSKK